MEHWYVYYKCPSGSLAQTVQRVRAMQAALAAVCAVYGRLLQRADDDGSSITMMEIYEPIGTPERFGAVLDEALAVSGVSGELRSARQTERFQDI